jgi:hypothetical protein
MLTINNGTSFRKALNTTHYYKTKKAPRFQDAL